MHVHRPSRRAEWLTEEDVMPWVTGSAGADEVALEVTENEQQAERRRRREAQKRRRPIGFVRWDDQDKS